MSLQANKGYVAKIELKTNTYYVSDRPDITLDSNDYQNVVTSWGNIEYNSDAFNGTFIIGSMDISVVNGEEYIGDGYVFDPTDVWNNYSCTVKKYTDGDVEFEQCTPIISGKIKNYNITENTLSFTIEQIDSRDDILLPAIVCEDHGDLNDAQAKATVVSGFSTFVVLNTGSASLFNVGELILITLDNSVSSSVYSIYPYRYNRIKAIDSTNTFVYLYDTEPYYYIIKTIEKPFRNIPEKFIGKTLPLQFGDLSDFTNGVFGKTITPNQNSGVKTVMYDYVELESSEHIGVWDDGAKRYYKAIKDSTQTSYIVYNTPPGQTGIGVTNPGFYNVGDNITLYNGTSSETVKITGITTASMAYTHYTQGPIGILTITPANTLTYVAMSSTVSLYVGEYSISDKKKHAIFYQNKTITLNINLNSSDNVSKLYFTNDDIRKIPYIDEDSKKVDSGGDCLAQTVLLINEELMLVVERPDLTTNSVVVERGYGNTNTESHISGSNVVIAESFGSKNLLSFRERFVATGACNFDYEKESYPIDGTGTNTSYNLSSNDATGYITSPISRMFESNSGTYFEYRASVISDIANANFPDSGRGYTHLSFNLMFDNISLDATVYKVNAAIDSTFSTSGSVGTHAYEVSLGQRLVLAKSSISYDETIDLKSNLGAIVFYTRVSDSYLPIIYSCTSYDDYDASSGMLNFADDHVYYDYGMTTLKDLNSMPRLFLMTDIYSWGGDTITGSNLTFNFKIYRIGLWISFFVDYTRENIVAPLEGRLITSDVDTITNGTTGSLCEHPIDVCAQILTQEMGYTQDNFTDSWNRFGTAAWVLKYGTVDSYDDVAYGNGLFVTVGDTVYGVTDDNGDTWTRGLMEYGKVAVTYGLGKFVSIGGSYSTGTSSIHTSTDGITWTKRDGLNDYWLDIAYGNGVFVIVGYNSGVLWSANGENWSLYSCPMSISWEGVEYGDGKFIAVGYTNTVMSSTDGITWTSYSCPSGSWTDITYMNGVWVAVGSGEIMSSDDGKVWVSRDVPSGYHPINKVTSGNGIFVAVETGGSLALKSYNGVDWEIDTTMVGFNWKSIAFGNNIFMAVSTYTPNNIAITDSLKGTNTCAFSYGVDDKRIKGIDFVSKLASHYNYLVTKNYESKIDIISIYNIYNETDSGNEINIDDILFLAESGQRRISIYQTGNDLIYNDVIVNYKRNNSTDEFQATYTPPDTFTLVKSNITIKQARDDYYNSEKRTLTIDSEFIYEEEEAQYLAETKLNQFAEVHFYAELYIDFDHYTEKNYLDEQYKIGDIIYLNGSHGGINFDSDRKFYIQNVILSDSGREVGLHLMSVDPISEF